MTIPMKKSILFVFTFFSLLASVSFAQTDSLVVSPLKDGNLCGFLVTVKNRNAAAKSIDEIRFQIVTANGTIWLDATGPFQWGTEITDDLNVKYTAQVNLLAPGATLSGFKLYFNIPNSEYDKNFSVNWSTLNGTQVVSSGSLDIICTPFQGQVIDTVTVSPSVINNDPYFNFTVTNRNAFDVPIARFIVQLQTTIGGTMRPSKVTAPSGWVVDSVTPLFAYFRTSTNPINGDESLGGFTVALRGNPAINKFTFNWFTLEEGNGLDATRSVIFRFPLPALLRKPIRFRRRLSTDACMC
jgi:hypothetical protein